MRMASSIFSVHNKRSVKTFAYDIIGCVVFFVVVLFYRCLSECVGGFYMCLYTVYLFLYIFYHFILKISILVINCF